MKSLMMFQAFFLVLEAYKTWRVAQHFFSCPSCSLQSVPVHFCDCDGYAQVKFNDSSVELGQQLLWQTMLPQLLQKINPLLRHFQQGTSNFHFRSSEIIVPRNLKDSKVDKGLLDLERG